MTETITLEVPQDVLASLKVGVQDLGQYMRLSAAIAYFQEKRLSLGKAAELAGINRIELMDILAQKGLTVFDYDLSEVEVELAGASILLKGAG